MARPQAAYEPIVYRLPSFVRTRVTAAPRGSAWRLKRVTWLTPYTAEEIAQEARRAGAGAQLEVSVPTLADTVPVPLFAGVDPAIDPTVTMWPRRRAIIPGNTAWMAYIVPKVQSQM